MQFTVNNSALVEALGWVAKSLPVRPSVPVLAGIKMTVQGSTLTLAAFDYEQSAVATVDVDTVAEGSVLVSGRLLADIARALPNADVKVTLDGTKLLVQAKTSRFSLSVMPDDDYPALPALPNPVGSVDANLFADAIKSVVPASGRDDMLPALKGIHVKIDAASGTLTLAATDRFRLAIRKIAFEAAAGSESIEVLIPARILDGWAKALTGEEGSRFTFGSGGTETNVFGVEASGRAATVRLLDGQFPKYEGLVPVDFTAEATVNSADLAAAVKRVSIVAEKNTPASLTFANDNITVSVAADSAATEDVTSQHVGGEVQIGFNVAFLLDGLNALGAKDASVSLAASSKPAVFRPVEGGDSYTYLLMPMRDGKR